MQHFLITATHYRAAKLATAALPSLLEQTQQNFHWILINDGPDPATRSLAEDVAQSGQLDFIYLEMKHPAPTMGFGLCHARNLGLEAAAQSSQGDRKLITYLDDDNELTPDFVARTQEFFQDKPTIQCSMVQQLRQRQVVQEGEIVRRGKPFISPSSDSDVEALIRQQALFDSNGFTHVLDRAPHWNPSHRIFADYEYFLQCLCQWGQNSFQLNPHVLVKYIQSSEGIIGQSNYGDWTEELLSLLEGDYPVLSSGDYGELFLLAQQWLDKVQQEQPIPAFVKEQRDDSLQFQSV